MKIRIKHYTLNMITLTILIVLAYLILILINLDVIRNNPKRLIYLLFPAPITFLYVLYSLACVWIDNNVIRYSLIGKKKVIERNQIEKIVLLTYIGTNKVEEIFIYKKNNNANCVVDDKAFITIIKKYYDLGQIVNALEKYNYNYIIENI